MRKRGAVVLSAVLLGIFGAAVAGPDPETGVPATRLERRLVESFTERRRHLDEAKRQIETAYRELGADEADLSSSVSTRAGWPHGLNFDLGLPTEKAPYGLWQIAPVRS